MWLLEWDLLFASSGKTDKIVVSLQQNSLKFTLGIGQNYVFCLTYQQNCFLFLSAIEFMCMTQLQTISGHRVILWCLEKERTVNIKETNKY